jgi:hypothetical protein
MHQKEIDKQRRCSHLLPPPGGEIVRAMLDEIERLQKKDEPTDYSGQLSCKNREVTLEPFAKDWCKIMGNYCCYGECREPIT